MKKCFAFLFVAFCLPSVEVSGQNDSLMKNEVGINLVPFVRMFDLGMNNYYQRFGIYLKRALNGSFYYRAGIVQVVNRRDDVLNSRRIKITGESAQALHLKTMQTTLGNEFNLFQGWEYRWGKRRVKQYAGFDLTYSRSKEYYLEEFETTTKTYLYTDSSGIPYYTSAGVDFNNVRDRMKDTAVAKSTTTINGIGIAPFYGLQFEFSRRWIVSVQLGINLSYRRSKEDYQLDTFNQYQDREYQSIDFSGAGLLNNVSLFYRF